MACVRASIKSNRTRENSPKKKTCDIDIEFIRNLFVQQKGLCYWFGIPMNITEYNKNDFFLPSVDRLDNSKGYTKDNIVLCSRMANYARNNLTVEEYQKHLEVLKNSFKDK